MAANDGATDSRKVTPDLRWAFWISFGIVSIVLAVMAVIELEVVLAGPARTSNPVPALLSVWLWIPLALCVTSIPFVWSVRRRMLSAEMNFPEAYRVPIVVARTTANSSKVLAGLLDSPAVRLWNLSYATLAIDSRGVHVLKGSGRSPGLIPAAVVEVSGFVDIPAGYASTLTAIVLCVHVQDEKVELPVAPIRLRGNLLRRLQRDDLESVHAKITSALAGAPLGSGPNWPF